jgi:hypothetical protein
VPVDGIGRQGKRTRTLLLPRTESLSFVEASAAALDGMQPICALCNYNMRREW